jgi:hypothetical protein
MEESNIQPDYKNENLKNWKKEKEIVLSDLNKQIN